MKTSKKINIVIIMLAIVLSLSFYSPLLTYAQNSNNEKTQNSNSNTETNENFVTNENGSIQTFVSAYHAISYAQNKLKTKVDYTTTASGKIVVDPHVVVKIPAGIESKTIVDANGNVYSVDACNAYQSWLNAQYGVESYSSINSDKIYIRETTKVNTETGIASFGGGYQNYDQDSIKNTFGYVSHSNIILIKETDIESVLNFSLNNNNYEVSVKLKSTAGDEVKQKLLKCAGLEKKPTVNELTATFTIDKYGNVLKVKYYVECTAQKRIDWQFIHAVLTCDMTAEIVQTYSNTGNNSFEIPSEIQLSN